MTRSRMDFTPIVTDPRDSAPDPMSGGPPSMNPRDWPLGTIELVKGSGWVSVNFFDRYSIVSPDWTTAYERAVVYSRDEMNHFAWHVYKANVWRFDQKQEIGPDGFPMIVPTEADLKEKELSVLGRSHDRNCGIDRLLREIDLTEAPWYAGEFPSAWFSTWHTPDPHHEGAYLEFTVCRPCTRGILLWMCESSGPGAWEYR